MYLNKVNLVMKCFSMVAWFICVGVNITYQLLGFETNLFDQNVYLTLFGFTYIIPLCLGILESWANAVMLALFAQLQNDDYNRKVVGEKGSRFHLLESE